MSHTLPNEPKAAENRLMSDLTYGTILCLLSDVIFSVAFLFVNFINHTDFVATWRADWILTFKEGIAACFALPIFFILWARGKAALPSIKVIGMLLVAAFFCEYIGITHHAISYGYAGMALALPIIRVMTIVGCVVLGALCLHEHMTKMKFATLVVLISAIVLFSFCMKSGASKQDILYYGHTLSMNPVLFGFLCAVITGTGYAIYTIILRKVFKTAKQDEDAARDAGKSIIPLSTYFVVALVFGFGSLCGLIATGIKGGLQHFDVIPEVCWWYILGAGVLSFAGFYLKNLSLKYATASKVAVMSVVQVLLQVFFGILFFKDPVNSFFFAGVFLTIVGIVLASRTN